MTRQIAIPGVRDVRATLDRAVESEHAPESGFEPEISTIVVACPPHPRFGGSRQDSRLWAVSDELGDRSIDCLRFDYGPFDDGHGEQTDTIKAVEWARERYDTVYLFGYSFGATVALLAAPRAADIDGLSLLASGTGVAVSFDPVAAFDEIDCPVQVVYGERDDAVEWAPIVEAARKRGCSITSLPDDHLFVGTQAKVAREVAEFFEAI